MPDTGILPDVVILSEAKNLLRARKERKSAL